MRIQRRHLIKIYFGFYTSNFLTDGRCEHAKMKQFTFVAVNIRSQYIYIILQEPLDF